WSTIDLVENDDLAWAGSPEVAINAGGDGAAVFLLGNDVWANRYDASGGSWSGEVSLESGSGAATAPKVGIDDAGNVIAVWNQSDGSRSNIWASRYDVGDQAWAPAALLETNNFGAAWEVDLAVSPGGSAVAVWAQDLGSGFAMRAASFDG